MIETSQRNKNRRFALMLNRKRASMRNMEDVIMQERLSEFESYVEGNSADPNAQLTLSLICEFKQELKQNKKESSKSKEPARSHRDESFRGWFGRLRQFQEWLKSRDDNHNASLVLRWIAEFEHKKIEEWLKQNVQSFLGDPPDTEFLHGFLSALLLVEEEALGLPVGSHPFAEARALMVEWYLRVKNDEIDSVRIH